MIPKQIKDIYFTDDYPREGCFIGVDVQDGFYSMKVYGPEEITGREFSLESYGAHSIEEVAEFFRQWLAGHKPRFK